MTTKEKMISLYHYIDLEIAHLERYELKKAVCEAIYQILINTDIETRLNQAYTNLLEALQLSEDNIKEIEE
jgi:hypothetical protein